MSHHLRSTSVASRKPARAGFLSRRNPAFASRLVAALSLASLLALWGCPGELDDPQRFINGGACPDIEEELFPQRCGQSNCHSAEDRAAMLDLVSPGLATRLVNAPASSDCSGMPLIDLSAPESSVLYTKMTPEFCGPSRMPILGDKFSEAELACVLEWIAALPGASGSPASSSSSGQGGGGQGGAGGAGGIGGMAQGGAGGTGQGGS